MYFQIASWSYTYVCLLDPVFRGARGGGGGGGGGEFHIGCELLFVPLFSDKIRCLGSRVLGQRDGRDFENRVLEDARASI